jgi:hypothetical protein
MTHRLNAELADRPRGQTEGPAIDSQLVHCPNCSALVPAEDINISALLGKCAQCDHLFRLPMADLPAASAPTLPTAEARPSCPSGIVHDVGMGGELYIRRSWFTPALFFLLFFCVAWDGFLVFWYTIAIFGKAAKGGGDWMMILFPLGHVAVGVGLTYFTLAGFFNKTQILVDRDELFLKHGPIPWWGNRRVAVEDIQGIELDPGAVTNGQQQYGVSVHHADGRQIVLLSSLPIRQAEYIAYVVAEHLQVPLHRNDTGTARLPPMLEGLIKTIGGRIGK